MEPEPPPVPAELNPVEESEYSTPDPYLRPVNIDLPTRAEFESGDPAALLKSFADGSRKMPIMELLKNRPESAETLAGPATIPSSEWFCLFSSEVAPGSIAALGNTTGGRIARSLSQKGESYVGLSLHTQFLTAVPSDGRTLRAEQTNLASAGGRRKVDIEIRDQQRNLVAFTHGYAVFVDATQRQRAAAPPAKRLLCSMLFTDIVESTQHAERLGDQKWQALLEEQRKRVRAEIARCDGIEIDTAGDGFFVRFDSPADALDCAVAVREGVGPLGIAIRAGVHTGECEVTGRDLAGMAVHIGARIQAVAGPNEILVSSTVKDLVIGSGRSFENRGEHTLKGVPGTWRLHALL